ncbi:hypothetical protein [Shimazuella alba]|uniref:Uncharacterized protein n=1 Tax=Shimazuella alba TaxID=2690964 RepID=A0A6I4VVZ8_9BACL|nr:hypothetical protein [Shimazuella alba]MXQ54761.1 hypothetical protein [Shimazuella alba]
MLAMLAIIGIMYISNIVGLLTVVIRNRKNLREIDVLRMQTDHTADRQAQIAALSAKNAALRAQLETLSVQTAGLNVLALMFVFSITHR